MAEVHIIGQVSGANNFPKSELSCKWEFVVGKDWNHVQGEDRGQTHVDLPLDGENAVWAHPIDVHYSTTSLTGWPKIIVQVFRQDIFGRNELCLML